MDEEVGEMDELGPTGPVVFDGPVTVEEPAQGVRLIYTGPSVSLVFEGVEFPFGVAVEADPEMMERLAAHPLAAEGHRLTLAE